MSIVNKFRSQFKELLALHAFDQVPQEIDHMNFRKTYFEYLAVVKQGIEKHHSLAKEAEAVQLMINDYIMRKLHR